MVGFETKNWRGDTIKLVMVDCVYDIYPVYCGFGAGKKTRVAVNAVDSENDLITIEEIGGKEKVISIGSRTWWLMRPQFVCQFDPAHNLSKVT